MRLRKDLDLRNDPHTWLNVGHLVGSHRSLVINMFLYGDEHQKEFARQHQNAIDFFVEKASIESLPEFPPLVPEPSSKLPVSEPGSTRVRTEPRK